MEKKSSGFVLIGGKKTSIKGKYAQKKGASNKETLQDSKRNPTGSNLPPKLNCAPVLRTIYRFRSTSAQTNVGITGSMLAGVCGMVVYVATTTARSIASSFRIRKLTVWPGLSTTASTSEVLWASADSTFQKDTAFINELPGGITNTSRSVFVPPKGTLSEMWHMSGGTGSAVMFTLSCPDESIIDLDIEFTLPNAQVGSTQNFVGSTGAGVFVYGYLDGPTLATIAPLGRPPLA